jgi:hypothetical protein
MTNAERTSERALCDVLPEDYGSPEWRETIAAVMDVARKRRPDDPEGWANEWLRKEYDRGDLRALGFCFDCGRPMTLRQIGCCVYSEPCDHYRAQGQLTRMRPYIAKRLAKITPERRAALLALVTPAEAPHDR